MATRWDDEDATQKNSGAPAPAGPKVLELVAQAVRESPDALKATMGDMALVGPPPSSEDEWTFRTASLRTVRERVGNAEVIVDEAFLVHPIRKLRPGPFAGTVLVGRSGSNDICIVHSSVSKLHARIAVKPDGLFLSDAGSSNGTFVNGKRLADGQEVRLSSGDFVMFGACHYVALDAPSLHAVLLRFSQMT